MLVYIVFMLRQKLAYRSYNTSSGRILAFYNLAKNSFSLLEDDAAPVVEMILNGKNCEEIVSHFVRERGESIAEELISFVDFWENDLKSQNLSHDTSRQPFTLPPWGKGESAEDLFYHRCADENILAVLNCEITYACSQRCVHCYNPHHNPEAAMSTEMWINIIDQAANLGVLRLVLTGGECTCHPGFWEILEHARSCNMAVTVQSNGLYFNSEEKMARLAALFPRSYEVSIYGATAETHEKITTIPGSWNKTLKSLEYAKRFNIPIAIKSPITTLNWQEAGQIADRARELGAGHQMDLCITSQNDGGRNPLKWRIQDKEVLKTIIRNEKLPLYHGMEKLARQKVIKRPLDGPLCGAGSNSLCISPTGNVTLCGGLMHSAGDVRYQSLEEIWNGNPRKAFLLTRLRDKVECAECELNGYCSMCPALSLNEKGNMFVKNEFDCLCAEARKDVMDSMKISNASFPIGEALNINNQK